MRKIIAKNQENSENRTQLINNILENLYDFGDGVMIEDISSSETFGDNHNHIIKIAYAKYDDIETNDTKKISINFKFNDYGTFQEAVAYDVNDGNEIGTPITYDDIYEYSITSLIYYQPSSKIMEDNNIPLNMVWLDENGLIESLKIDKSKIFTMKSNDIIEPLFADAPSYFSAEWAYYNLKEGERVTINDIDDGLMDILKREDGVKVSFFDMDKMGIEHSIRNSEPVMIDIHTNNEIESKGLILPKNSSIKPTSIEKKNYYQIGDGFHQTSKDVKAIFDKSSSDRNFLENILGRSQFGNDEEVDAARKAYSIESDFNENGDYINSEVGAIQEFVISFEDNSSVNITFENGDSKGILFDNSKVNPQQREQTMADKFIEINNETPDYYSMMQSYDKVFNSIEIKDPEKEFQKDK